MTRNWHTRLQIPLGLILKKYIVVLAFVCSFAQADMADKLSRLEGYSIVKTGTITGWQNSDGKRGDSFEGCEYGRHLFIDDSFRITCADYFYEYGYRPTIVILSKNGNLKMIIGNDIHNAQR